jgi:hypothetical protein
VRAFLTIALCLALVLTLQQAPLLHVHEHGQAAEHVTAEHRHGLGAHTHRSPHSNRSRQDASQFEKADDNESVVSVPFFRSESPKASVQPAIILACPLMDTPTPFLVRVASERPRNHDPPFPSSLVPRAPPA